MSDDIFAAMAAKWPSAIVTRPQIETFTGGLIRGSYVANLDAAGDGPPKIKIGRQKWAYPVHEFAEWLRTRSNMEEKVNEKPNME
jgi:hypothetical protein